MKKIFFLLLPLIFFQSSLFAQCGSGACPPGAINTLPAGGTIAVGTTYCISGTINNTTAYTVNGTLIIQSGSVTVGDLTVGKTGSIIVNGGGRLMANSYTGETTAPASIISNMTVCTNGYLYLSGAINPGETNFAVNDYAVSGSDVYISGVSGNSNGEVASYWKNGVRDTLTAGPLVSTATSVAVSGNDVYVAGTIAGFLVNAAVYWKNGVRFNLTNSTTTGFATGITLDANNNVYVSGGGEAINDNPSMFTILPMLYWKNGALVNSKMTYGNNSNLDYENIAVAGADVYVAGAFSDSAAYWKNDSLVQLPGYGGEGYAIALAPY